MVARTNTRAILLILGALITVSPFSIDMYLPAFDRIAQQLHSTTEQVSLSLASFFIGMSLGQIFYGPFLDRYGRKKPLYVGLALYILATVGCMSSKNVEQLLLFRFFQALGGCSASVAATAMVRDFFSPEDGAKVFSRLMLILSVSPLFAPTVGSWIVGNWGWQAVFFVLALIVCLFLVIIFFFLPEGHEPDPEISLDVRSIFKTFGYIMKDPTFFSFTVSGAFSLAGLYIYLSGAPSIFFGNFHLSEKTFGMIFAFLSIGMVGGGQINILLMKRFTPIQIYTVALRVQTLTALAFVMGNLFLDLGLIAHICIFFIYISCVGLTYPNAAALALSGFAENSGSASALLGTVQTAIGALAAGCFGFLKLPPSLAVATIFLFTAVIGLLIFQMNSARLQLLHSAKPKRSFHGI